MERNISCHAFINYFAKLLPREDLILFHAYLCYGQWNFQRHKISTFLQQSSPHDIRCNCTRKSMGRDDCLDVAISSRFYNTRHGFLAAAGHYELFIWLPFCVISRATARDRGRNIIAAGNWFTAHVSLTVVPGTREPARPRGAAIA